MPAGTPTFVAGRHREWVLLLSGERISSLRSHDAFLEAIRTETHGIAPQIERVRALYLLSEPHGRLLAACCFTLGFDPRGRIPREFSLPLRELALASKDGPDLGAGPIRLAHQAQCSIPWHAERLWGRDPHALKPWLDAAQQLLCRRLRDRDVPRAAPQGDSEAGTIDGVAVQRAEIAFGPEHRLTPDQLEAGRRLARRRATQGTGADGGGPSSAAGQLELLAEQVELLKARHEREIAELQQEIERLRRRLRAAESPDDREL